MIARVLSVAASVCVAALLTLSAPARAAVPCGSGNFDAWLAEFRTEAAGKGISQNAINAALTGVSPDQGVINRDHGQKVFSQPEAIETHVLKKTGKVLATGRAVGEKIAAGKIRLVHNTKDLRAFRPGEVLVAIWGLETDFGVNVGKFPTIRALATLAYDCRRAEQFRGELLDALRIVDRGDLQPGEMRGAWAGEIGQTQFMPSSWIKYAVDFDGNGRRDLIRSAPDVLASTANYLKGYGWQKGKDWEPGGPNFAVIQQWNKSEVYARTIATFATQLARAP